MARCTACEHDNEPGAHYCSSCGEPTDLARVCPACDAPARASQCYCSSCGGKLDGTPAPAPAWRAAGPGERKHVTVLFADVKESTHLSSSVELDQWWTIIERFYELLRRCTERFDGRVDRYTGDGMMAVFGVPHALEDHARRACHAALSLQRELARFAEQLREEQAIPFHVRLGLSSGEVVAGNMGEQLGAAYATVGHAAALAQRMESIAEPGGILLAEPTASLVRRYFPLGERGAMRVKGLDAPVRVFELLGDERPGKIDGGGGVGTRFVGREREVAELERALRRSLAGDGQVLDLVGEAGVGKTRLCHEQLERWRARGIAVSQAHALGHMRSVPFAPVLELLRDQLGLAPGESGPLAHEKVAAQLRALPTLSAGEQASLLDFLGLTEPAYADPEARQRRLLDALERLLRARAERFPSVILLEDLHWIDPASANFLQRLVAAVAGTRTLLLTTRRPEPRPSWTAAAHCSTLRLLALATDAGAALLADLLGDDRSLDGVGALVYERADGNPFFIEEIVNTLAEVGTLRGERGAYRLTRTIEEVEIPATVQSVLAARIDRLHERDKRVLQAAAVIGRRFSGEVLGRVVGLEQRPLGEALAALRDAELVRPGDGPDEHLFKHALGERVAYSSQLADTRARTHAAVASASAELYPDRLDELAALIARHWELAHEPLQAAQWCARAAGWAGFNDPREALRQWQRARELSDAAPESPARSELALGTRVMLLNLAWRQGVPEGMPREQFEADMAEVFEQARTLATATQSATAQTIAVAAYGAVRGSAGHLEDMAELGASAVALADACGEAGLKLSVLPCAVYGLHGLGRFDRILELLGAVMRELPEDAADVVGVTMVCPYAWILCWQASAHAHTGRLADAFRGFQRALAVARAHGDSETESWTHFSIVQAMQLAGGGDALLHGREALRIAEGTGAAFSVGHAWRYLGIAHLLAGQDGQAVDALQRALVTWRSRRVGLEAEPHALAMLARAQLGVGDPQAACVTAHEAIDLASERRTRNHELEARLALLEALRARDGAEAVSQAGTHVARARELLGETGARTLAPRIHAEMAQLARLAGDDARYNAELLEAQALFAAVGATPLAQATERALAMA